MVAWVWALLQLTQLPNETLLYTYSPSLLSFPLNSFSFRFYLGGVWGTDPFLSLSPLFACNVSYSFSLCFAYDYSKKRAEPHPETNAPTDALLLLIPPPLLKFRVNSTCTAFVLIIENWLARFQDVEGRRPDISAFLSLTLSYLKSKPRPTMKSNSH